MTSWLLTSKSFFGSVYQKAMDFLSSNPALTASHFSYIHIWRVAGSSCQKTNKAPSKIRCRYKRFTPCQVVNQNLSGLIFCVAEFSPIRRSWEGKSSPKSMKVVRFTWHIHGKWTNVNIKKEREWENETEGETLWMFWLHHNVSRSSMYPSYQTSRELNMSWFGTQLPPELSVHWGQTIVNYLKSCQSIQEPCWTFPLPMLSANTNYYIPD